MGDKSNAVERIFYGKNIGDHMLSMTNKKVSSFEFYDAQRQHRSTDLRWIDRDHIAVKGSQRNIERTLGYFRRACLMHVEVVDDMRSLPLNGEFDDVSSSGSDVEFGE